MYIRGDWPRDSSSNGRQTAREKRDENDDVPRRPMTLAVTSRAVSSAAAPIAGAHARHPSASSSSSSWSSWTASNAAADRAEIAVRLARRSIVVPLVSCTRGYDTTRRRRRPCSAASARRARPPGWTARRPSSPVRTRASGKSPPKSSTESVSESEPNPVCRRPTLLFVPLSLLFYRNATTGHVGDRFTRTGLTFAGQYYSLLCSRVRPSEVRRRKRLMMMMFFNTT